MTKYSLDLEVMGKMIEEYMGEGARTILAGVGPDLGRIVCIRGELGRLV